MKLLSKGVVRSLVATGFVLWATIPTAHGHGSRGAAANPALSASAPQRSAIKTEVKDGSFAWGYQFVPVLTDNWPFVPRAFHGTPDESFQEGRRGGDGQNGPPPPRNGLGGFGQGGPGGGPGGGGPPTGMVPGAYLETYFELTGEQKRKLDDLIKAVDALGRENFAIPALARLKLTNDQIRKIAAGESVRAVLTAEQKKVLDANRRPARSGPGGRPGPGGFGGGPFGGGPGGEGGPPPPRDDAPDGPPPSAS